MSLAYYTPVFFIASIKFLFAPSTGIGLGMTFWETLIVCSIGGIVGVSVFYFAAGWFMNKMHERRIKKEEEQKKKGTFVKKKVFTPFRRKVIRVKNSFGVIGISFLTPCILSIPIGSVLAARFFHHHKLTIVALYLSVISWAFILTYFNDVVASIFR